MKFTELTTVQQSKIASKFNLPTNKDNLFVDEHNRPYEQEKIGRFYCSINKNHVFNSFHVHELKETVI